MVLWGSCRVMGQVERVTVCFASQMPPLETSRSLPTFPVMMERLRRTTANIYGMLTQHFSGKKILFNSFSKPLRKLLSKSLLNT